MRPEQTPFPQHWWGTCIDDIAERPLVGTYGRYNTRPLPALPFKLSGKFDWLTRAQTHTSHIGRESSRANLASLTALIQAAARLGVPLPAPFLSFMTAT
jgi:hypothetical protein